MKLEDPQRNADGSEPVRQPIGRRPSPHPGIVLSAVILLFCAGTGHPKAGQQPLNGTIKITDGGGRLKARLSYRQGHLIRKRVYHTNGLLLTDTVFDRGKEFRSKYMMLTAARKVSGAEKRSKRCFMTFRERENLLLPIRSAETQTNKLPRQGCQADPGNRDFRPGKGFFRGWSYQIPDCREVSFLRKDVLSKNRIPPPNSDDFQLFCHAKPVLVRKFSRTLT